MQAHTPALLFVLAAGCASQSQPAISPIAGPDPAESIPSTPQAMTELEPAPMDADDCRGADLDLATLAVRRSCDLERTAGPRPTGLAVSLREPRMSVAAGQNIQTELVFRNTTVEPLSLELDASCGFANVAHTNVVPSKWDTDPDALRCDAVTACGGHAIAVVIEPGESAFLRLDLDTPIRSHAPTCERLPGKTLARGDYKVEVYTALSPAPLIGSLRVR